MGIKRDTRHELVAWLILLAWAVHAWSAAAGIVRGQPHVHVGQRAHEVFADSPANGGGLERRLPEVQAPRAYLFEAHAHLDDPHDEHPHDEHPHGAHMHAIADADANVGHAHQGHSRHAPWQAQHPWHDHPKYVAPRREHSHHDDAQRYRLPTGETAAPDRDTLATSRAGAPDNQHLPTADHRHKGEGWDVRYVATDPTQPDDAGTQIARRAAASMLDAVPLYAMWLPPPAAAGRFSLAPDQIMKTRNPPPLDRPPR